MRQLERQIGAVARKVARKIAAGEIDRADGRAARTSASCWAGPRVHPERCRARTRGRRRHGHVLHAGRRRHHVRRGAVAAPRPPSRTGNRATAGNVADPDRPARRRDEGVGARRLDLRARPTPRDLGIPDDELGSIEVHIHVPAGAIPKDGPSAGVAMATAIVSAMSGRPVRSDVAMTGEITLRGRVLPIGGVKEKVLGADRAGITDDHPAEGQRGRPRGHPRRGARQDPRCPRSRSWRGAGDRAARREPARRAAALQDGAVAAPEDGRRPQ